MSGSARDMRARLVLSVRDSGARVGLEVLQNRLERIRSSMSRLAAVTAIGAGLSWMGPMQQAAQFDDALRQTAITAGLSGTAVEQYIAQQRAAYERLALEVGQRSRDLVAAASGLVAAGMRQDQVLPAMELIGRAATATGATMDDLGRTYFQLQQQLGITTAEMPNAFAILVTGAKEGNFELRDMAREFPAILAAARALRIEGLGGTASLTAMLQLARTAAGSSSEAANNVLNALQKLASPETVRQFREVGVNIEGLMDSAVRQGINPVEAVVQRLRQLTGGNLFRMQELFGDRQALMGLLPMLQETGRFLEIRDQARNASPDIIGEDFASRMRGMQQQMVLAEERVEQLSRRFLLSLTPAITSVNSALETLQSWVAAIDTSFPGLIDQATSWASTFLLGAAALGIVGNVASFVFSGLGTLLRAAVVLVQPLIWAFTALAAVVGAPVAGVIAAIAVIAGAAYLIYDNWDRLGPWFNELWQMVQRYFSEFLSWIGDAFVRQLEGYVTIIQGVWYVLSTWFNTLWQTWVVAPFEWFVSFLDSWTGGMATAQIQNIMRTFEALRDFFSGLFGGIIANFEAIWARIEPILNRVREFFGAAEGAGEGQITNPENQAERRRRMGARGAAGGFYAPEAALPGGGGGDANVRGEIVVRAAPGTVVEDARGEGGVTLAPRNPPGDAPPNRGPTRGRP